MLFSRFVIALCLLFLLTGCGAGSSGTPECVPLPPTRTPDPRPATATPYPGQAADPNRPTLLPEMPTPIPFAHQVDLSPEMADRDKAFAIVYRCDGTWDLYKGDPALIPTAIPRSPGDLIYSSWPPQSLKVDPPEPTIPNP